MQNNNSTNPDNQPNQPPNCGERQAKKLAPKKPDTRTDENSKLPSIFVNYESC
jgi:hypothetical protein